MRNYVDFWVSQVLWQFGDPENPSIGSFYTITGEKEEIEDEQIRKLGQLGIIDQAGFRFIESYRAPRWIIVNSDVILHLMWVLDGWESYVSNPDPTLVNFPSYIVTESPRDGNKQAGTDFVFVLA
jgi:hypothetical protein